MKELPKHAKQFQFDGKNYQIKVSKGDIDEYIIRAFISRRMAILIMLILRQDMILSNRSVMML